MKNPSAAAWVCQQLLAESSFPGAQYDQGRAKSATATRTALYNPRPPGRPLRGSPTEKVLLLLAQRQPVRQSFSQILLATNLSRAAIDHALGYLRALGYIEAEADLTRNLRYLRYTITKKGVSYAHEISQR